MMVDVGTPGAVTGYLSVAVSEVDGHLLIELDGEVDLHSVEALRSCLSAALAVHNRVWVDMSRVTFLGSTGINVLVLAYRAAGSVREAVTLVSPSPRARHVLEMAGLADVFAIVD